MTDKIRIRKSKHQKENLTHKQIFFAFMCVDRYFKGKLKTVFVYTGGDAHNNIECEVYRTKTGISAIVYFR